MLTRIQPRALAGAVRADVPGPVDVVNLITTERFDRYRWYALLVLPVLTAVGGRVLWMARSERTLVGEPQAEKLLLVRYPSHRHFLAMTVNPYYFAINRLREAGVRRFEASFTHASHTGGALHRRRRLVGVHFSGDLETIVEETGWELVYATRATAPLAILRGSRPTDPNPLTYEGLALFESEGPEQPVATRLGAMGCAVAVYEREPRSGYRPMGRA